MLLPCPIPSRSYPLSTKGMVKENVRGRGENGAFLNPRKFLKSLAPSLLAGFIAVSPIYNPPVSFGHTLDAQSGGATLFHQACIGCHAGGGNLLQPGATLLRQDLQRNGVDTEEEIFRVTYYGKGRMPGFGENCTPRGQCTFGPRLKEDEIRLLAEFVKAQADQGWPNGEALGD